MKSAKLKDSYAAHESSHGLLHSESHVCDPRQEMN